MDSVTFSTEKVKIVSWEDQDKTFIYLESDMLVKVIYVTVFIVRGLNLVIVLRLNLVIVFRLPCNIGLKLSSFHFLFKVNQ